MPYCSECGVAISIWSTDIRNLANSLCANCLETAVHEEQQREAAEQQREAEEQQREAVEKQLQVRREFQESKGLMRVEFRVFRLDTFGNWESLFEEAASFANQLSPEALINISHSAGDAHGSHAVTVWFWSKQIVEDTTE